MIAAAEAGTAAYQQAGNDMQKGGSRASRAAALCRAMGNNGAVAGWRGAVATLSSNGDGDGVLVITIAPGITVKTWNNGFSDIGDKTLIPSTSALFGKASALHEREKVTFAGHFFSSKTDCIKEGSATLDGSMTDPEFIFQFRDIAPAL